jgi:hypothetical protein
MIVAISKEKLSYLILLVNLLYAPLTLRLRDDLCGTLNNDLISFKHSHYTHANAKIQSIIGFDTIFMAVSRGTSLKLGKGAVATCTSS